jgi:hypothetical protein
LLIEGIECLFFFIDSFILHSSHMLVNSTPCNLVNSSFFALLLSYRLLLLYVSFVSREIRKKEMKLFTTFGSSNINEYPLIRIAAPFIIVIIAFFAFYYGRVYINSLIRKGEIGYEGEKARKEKRNTSNKELDDEYYKILQQSMQKGGFKGDPQQEPEEKDDNRPIVGKTDLYEWTQTNDEIEVYFPLSKYGESISSREIDVTISSKKLTIILRREVLLKEEFSFPIKVDDSCWMLDNNTIGDPHLYITLVKSSPSLSKSQFWKSLFVGGPEVKIPLKGKGRGGNGPEIHSLDPSDNDAMKEALESVSN